MAPAQPADRWFDWKVSMGPTKHIARILIAERNLLFRRGLSALFAGDPSFSVAGEASAASDVIAQILSQQPNVLVIEAALLNESRDRLGAALRQAQPGISVLVLAQEDDEQSMAAAISVGAKGFTLKSAGSRQLMAALQTVAFQEGAMNISGLLPEFEALARHTPTNKNILTAREQEVVKLLAEGRTVRSVANELSLSMKTIEAHKLNLMRKLDIHDRASLVAYASRSGMLASAKQGS